MSRKISKKQKEVLEFIKEFIIKNGYSPSYREIAKSLELKSVATVAAHVNNLVTAGYVKKVDGSARTLEVMDDVGVQSMSHGDWLKQKIKTSKNGANSHEVDILDEAAKILGVNLDE